MDHILERIAALRRERAGLRGRKKSSKRREQRRRQKFRRGGTDERLRQGELTPRHEHREILSERSTSSLNVASCRKDILQVETIPKHHAAFETPPYAFSHTSIISQFPQDLGRDTLSHEVPLHHFSYASNLNSSPFQRNQVLRQIDLLENEKTWFEVPACDQSSVTGIEHVSRTPQRLPFRPPPQPPILMDGAQRGTNADWRDDLWDKRPHTLSNHTLTNLETSILLQPVQKMESLYLEHPDKWLRGFESDTLLVVARTFQQVAEEAVHRWLKRSCPQGPSINRSSCLEAVTNLLANTRALCREAFVVTPAILIRIVRCCRSLCTKVQDNKSEVLLRKAKEKVEWLRIELDCKRLDYLRRALRAFEALYRSRRLPEATRLDADSNQDEELSVLDGTFEGFQEQRLEARVELFRTLKELLMASV